MRLGRLDKLITIERRILVGASSMNEPQYEFETYRRCWAEAYDVRSAEAFSEDTKQRYAETTTRFRVHYGDAVGLDATMRIRYEGRLYDIKSILVDHVRKQTATIDAVAQSVTVGGAVLEAVADVPDNATVGNLFQAIITIFGGQAPYSVSVADSPAVLPPGLALVQSSDNAWAIEGFPVAVGTWPISLVVSDAAGNIAAIEPFTITIASS